MTKAWLIPVGLLSALGDCEHCIDDRSCAGATFSCSSECLGIVP